MSLAQNRIAFALAQIAQASDPAYADQYKNLDVSARSALETMTRWRSAGFPQIALGHRLAASLMCTSMPDDITIRAPWPEFQVLIPHSLIPYESTSLALVHVSAGKHVSSWDDKKKVEWAFAVYLANSDDPRSTRWFIDLGATERGQTVRGRLITLLSDLVTGICIELETVPLRKQILLGPSRRSPSKRRSPVPTAWTFRLTRDVKVDMRDAVYSYCLGTRGTTPKVQSLVRGHYKRQPCGPDGASRKWIHIEPYWRGPEDAPIAVRAHVLSS